LISKKPASIECGNKVLAIVVTRFSYSARGLPGFTLLQKAHQRAFQGISPGYRDKIFSTGTSRHAALSTAISVSHAGQAAGYGNSLLKYYTLKSMG